MPAPKDPNQPEPKRVNNAAKPNPFPPVTTTFLAICTFIYAGLALQNNYTSVEAVARFGYLPAPLVYEGGYWSLITSAFVHFDLIHLVFNAAWIVKFGSSSERVMGSIPYLLFYAIAAFISSSMQLAISGNTGIGASGVVYALFGFMWVTRKRIPSFSPVIDKQIIKLFIGWLFFCIGLSYFNILNIGNAAHFSGMVFGMLVGAIVIRYKFFAALAGLTTAIAFSFISLFWSPWSIQWLAYKAYQAHDAKAYDLALNYYNRLLQKDDGNAWAYYNRALVHDSIGNSQLAQSDWEKARQLDPSLTEREPE